MTAAVTRLIEESLQLARGVPRQHVVFLTIRSGAGFFGVRLGRYIRGPQSFLAHRTEEIRTTMSFPRNYASTIQSIERQTSNS
jgi:hypothetical protein